MADRTATMDWADSIGLPSTSNETEATRDLPSVTLAPNPLVSIVIGTRNSAKTLRQCLEGVQSQTYQPLEIVVVDNFSSDTTVSIAREFTGRIFALGPERCAQYNHGFKVARGQFLYRLDSDFVLEPTVVRDAMNVVAQGCDAVIVPDTADSTVSFWARVKALEKNCYVDDDWNVAARFFKASVIRMLGGYNEELIGGEDYDLQNRLLKAGYRVGRIKSGAVHLDEPRSLKEVYEKQFFYGTTLRSFLSTNESRGFRQLLPFRTAYLRHWRDFVRNPDLAAGFVVYEFVKYTAAWRGWVNAGPKPALLRVQTP